MSANPFNLGTKLATIFTILSDGKWHCGKHELPGTQPAKAIQIMRQHGFKIENSTTHCSTCGDRTVHRRLLSTTPESPSFVRMGLPEGIRARVLAHYGYRDAITLRELPPHQLEVDHRFPQVRWSCDEALDPGMSEREISAKFQLLTRENNLWKSRHCERCFATGERGAFPGIDYYASGGPRWDPSIPPDDERGCKGCFWYDPAAWRMALNGLVKTVMGGK